MPARSWRRPVEPLAAVGRQSPRRGWVRLIWSLPLSVLSAKTPQRCPW